MQVHTDATIWAYKIVICSAPCPSQSRETCFFMRRSCNMQRVRCAMLLPFGFFLVSRISPTLSFLRHDSMVSPWALWVVVDVPQDDRSDGDDDVCRKPLESGAEPSGSPWEALASGAPVGTSGPRAAGVLRPFVEQQRSLHWLRFLVRMMVRAGSARRHTNWLRAALHNWWWQLQRCNTDHCRLDSPRSSFA